MVSLSKPTLTIGAFARSFVGSSRRSVHWLPERLGNAILTYRGCTALALGCERLALRPGDVVLAPSYNCGMEIDVLRALGLSVRLYAQDRTGRFKLEDIKRLYSPETKLIYVTHYFGWDHDLSDILKWASGKGIAVLEDCALSLFSTGTTGALGRLGDIAIYSFPKSVPVPDGGALVMNRSSDTRLGGIKQPPRAATLFRTLSLVNAPALRAVKHWLSKEQPKPPSARRHEMPDSYYFNKSEQAWQISSTTTHILGNVNPDEVIAKRRANFSALLEAIKPIKDIKPLYDSLPRGVCPLCLPVVAENRTAVWHYMNSHGIATSRWWAGYHNQLPWDDFPEACFLKDRVLALPIHQSLDSDQVQYVGETLFNATRR